MLKNNNLIPYSLHTKVFQVIPALERLQIVPVRFGAWGLSKKKRARRVSAARK